MAEPWTADADAPMDAPEGIVTLVEGSAFCISDQSGDVRAGTPQGLIFQDTRFLSRFELRIDGELPEPLSATKRTPFSCRFLLRVRPGAGVADSSVLIHRDRYIGRGLREDVAIVNLGESSLRCRLELTAEADFASVFAVKEDRDLPNPKDIVVEAGARELRFASRRNGSGRGVRVTFSQPATMDGRTATFDVLVPPRSTWTTCVQVTPRIDSGEIEPRHLCGRAVDESTPEERLRRWRQTVPVVATNHESLQTLLARSADDLGALRIFDPEFPDRTVIAAGAPWFMTLFGRDSLLTAWMALIVDPDLALGVLQTLARFQGTKVDPETEEEPGRILHEMRFGEASSLSFGGGFVYYGSVDATPLFVMLLGELRRWGLARSIVDSLLPNAERALAWIEEFGDRDGDGYVEYQRATEHGLVNQGWKDSWDAIRFADGRLADTPIALCEVQAYVYGAYLARAHFADEVDDAVTAARFRKKAANLKAAFNRDFWVEEHGWFAMGLDRDKKPIDALASNMGQCLWTGIVEQEKAERIADRLLEPELFSGWGVRTLASSMRGYNPVSYHNGSVWPHDNAIIAAGLMRYGFVPHAHRVMRAVVRAGLAGGGRLPELFAGLSRSEFPVPVSYPTSCSPQAWAAATPLLFLRTILRFDPWVPHGKVWVAPTLPREMTNLRVDRIPLAGSRVSITVEGDEVMVEGLPGTVEAVLEPRHPLTGID
jgi:glycogen debranching enzyme